MLYKVPAYIKNNAKKGLALNKAAGSPCNNRIGQRRAVQLINRKEINIITVKKMYSYLSRAKTYYQPGNTSACGTISFLLWGGIPALSWSKKIIADAKK